MNYKYTLDPSSKKFPCPACGKVTLVRFIKTGAAELLNEEFGRCDRETNCGYFRSPINNKPIVNINDVASPLVIPNYHQWSELEKTQINGSNNFLTYLKSIFDEEDVKNLVTLFHIGSCSQKWENATVFWQVDLDENVRAGKMMLYHNETGSRIKSPYNHINWMHKVNQHSSFNLSQCLFGLHLLNLQPLDHQQTHDVRIVESEKTAVIMMGLMPQYIWMATGSKSNFKESMLIPLKSYKVVAYPDKSEYDNWNTAVDQLNDKGFNIKVSRLLENMNLELGADLIDLSQQL